MLGRQNDVGFEFITFRPFPRKKQCSVGRCGYRLERLVWEDKQWRAPGNAAKYVAAVRCIILCIMVGCVDNLITGITVICRFTAYSERTTISRRTPLNREQNELGKKKKNAETLIIIILM